MVCQRVRVVENVEFVCCEVAYLRCAMWPEGKYTAGDVFTLGRHFLKVQFARHIQDKRLLVVFYPRETCIP